MILFRLLLGAISLDLFKIIIIIMIRKKSFTWLFASWKYNTWWFRVSVSIFIRYLSASSSVKLYTKRMCFKNIIEYDIIFCDSHVSWHYQILLKIQLWFVFCIDICYIHHVVADQKSSSSAREHQACNKMYLPSNGRQSAEEKGK